MPSLLTGRLLPAACLLALSAGASLAGHPDSSAGRASELAVTVSRAIACRAGSPQRTTLDRFLDAEKTRGASDDELAAARSAYITVSEAETVNQSVQPQGCTAEERTELKLRMARIRAGDFEER
ncbi:hypothetical protein FQV39_29635 [Bosea sp. F3-2]|uniref:hypothetical protein n=1 Tax=Bosea sp. F3-2 TaxID=2599640 RepID=UPI0011EC5651|nr:hypothetical protein [Bosea sp. F3-2]QEL26303.1 hypothetical protein FQV39_29635 [Bosea sp. F3-2]